MASQATEQVSSKDAAADEQDLPDSVTLAEARGVRVAYLVNQYPLGSHTFIRREIRALEKLGVSIERFSIRDTSASVTDPADKEESLCTTPLLGIGCVFDLFRTALVKPVRFFKATLEGMRFGRADRLGVVRTVALLAESCRFARLTRLRKVQHCHAHFGTNSAAVAMLSYMLGGPPFSFTVHGPEEFDRPQALRLGEKIRAAKFVVAISHFGRSQLCRWAPVAEWDKLHVIRCGVDESFLEGPLTPPSEKPVLVCVGRLCEQKGQLVLVEAAKLLRDRGVEFEIRLVGDGPMRAELEQAIQAYDLQRHVTLVGWCDGARVREEILASRAMVLPSFAEGLPVVLMEAMALGRPVISTYVAGIPELVKSGVNGWLVPAGSTKHLADAITDAIECNALRLRELGVAGRSSTFNQHTIKMCAVEILKAVS